MKGVYEAVKVSDRVWWVGAIDWHIRDFHGYQTPRGSTYNAYLIEADDPILVDTVKAPFRGELLSRVASVIGDPAKIRYIVSNHAEMDHSGSLPEVIAAVRPEKVFTSRMGAEALAAHFDLADALTAVENGQTIELAGVHLSFTETRMIHWPDSMFTYLAEDRLLFSQDGFSMHLASGERFDDELDPALLYREAASYYANILLPYSQIVSKAIRQLKDSGLDIRIIATDHGPIWRSDVTTIVELWDRWAAQKPTKKAVVLFDSMWQSTAKMARAISEGLVAGGAEVRELSARANHRTDAANEILEAGALVVGSPTLNGTIFPALADSLTYLKGLKRRNLIGGVFGSYGWGGEAAGQLREMLESMKIEVVADDLKVKYVPKAADLEACREYGVKFAKRLAQHVEAAGSAAGAEAGR